MSAAGSFELRQPTLERIVSLVTMSLSRRMWSDVVPQWWWEEAEHGVVRRASHGFTGHQCLPYQDALLIPNRHSTMALSDEVKREIGQVSQGFHVTLHVYTEFLPLTPFSILFWASMARKYRRTSGRSLETITLGMSF